MRHLIAVLWIFCASTTWSLADAITGPQQDWQIKLNVDFSSPGPHEQRSDHTLYKVSFECKPIGSLPVRTVHSQLFSSSTITTSHAILITNDNVTPDASGKIPLASVQKPLRLITPYAMNGSSIADLRKICPDPFVLAGSKPTYLVPIANYSASYSPGVLVQVGYLILKLVPSLWSVFQPEAIPADINRKVSGIQQTEDPIKSLFSKFNTDDSYGAGFTLDVGRYVIKTAYNQVTITVAKMPSVVLAMPSKLQEDFRDQLKAAPEQIKPESTATTCEQIAVALKAAGFSEDEDIPYALTFLSSKLATKPKMLECLGNDYAEPAVKLGKILWSWMPKKLVVTEMDVQLIQPASFADAKQSIYNFIVGLSKISKGDAASAAEGLGILKLVAKEKLKFEDASADGLAGGSADDLTADQIAKRFIDHGYRRFGCMAPVGDKNGAVVDSAVGSFLAINATVDAKGANVGDALPVHVVYSRGLIADLRVYKEDGWAQVNADANEGNCNGFKLKKAPAVANSNSPSVKQVRN